MRTHGRVVGGGPSHATARAGEPVCDGWPDPPRAGASARSRGAPDAGGAAPGGAGAGAVLGRAAVWAAGRGGVA